MTRNRMHRIPLPLLSALGLIALAVVNLTPIFLVARQAFSPEDESITWPLRLLPNHISAENLLSLWRTQSLFDHLALSIGVALGTTVISLLLGFPAGWAAARSRLLENFTTRTALISRILPPIALAIPLTALLIPLQLYNHPLGLGLILAHLTIGMPFAILLSYAAFRDVPRELEDAAHVDGCVPFEAFFRVSLPAARGAITSAFILIFLLSWDEFAYALLIQLTHRTLPPLLYYYTEYGQLASASALAMLMLIPSVLVIVLLQKLLSRSILTGSMKM
jgi:multiple sugar transport system permease protein